MRHDAAFALERPNGWKRARKDKVPDYDIEQNPGSYPCGPCCRCFSAA